MATVTNVASAKPQGSDVIHDTETDFYGELLATADSAGRVCIYRIPQLLGPNSPQQGQEQQSPEASPQTEDVALQKELELDCELYAHTQAALRCTWSPPLIQQVLPPTGHGAVAVSSGSSNASPCGLGSAQTAVPLPLLASCSLDGSVVIYSRTVGPTWRPVYTIFAPSAPMDIAWGLSPFSTELLLAVGCCDGDVYLYECPAVPPATAVGAILSPICSADKVVAQPVNSVIGVSFSGKWLCAAHCDGWVRLYHFESKESGLKLFSSFDTKKGSTCCLVRWPYIFVGTAQGQVLQLKVSEGAMDVVRTVASDSVPVSSNITSGNPTMTADSQSSKKRLASSLSASPLQTIILVGWDDGSSTWLNLDDA